MVEMLTRNWGVMVSRGVIAIIFGLLALFNPGTTLATLVLLFGVFAIVDGAFMIFSAIANRRNQPRWGTLILGGILGIAIGAMTLFRPGITAVALLAMIAIWAIIIGIAEIVAAIRLRKEITGEWMFVLTGLLAVAFGAVLIMRPGVGALAMIVYIGAFAVVTGVLEVAFGLRLRNWGRQHGTMQPQSV
ncbi:MAG TPA: HdeD family acid-resistance protein [Gemmatimonadaceae bacterium]|jgi:uncharacterized membrane protein HdeD (DUF308 family)|nr:HdeD family acid-resistance protein [Gemmatimonadaceae bacterium]